MHFLIVAQEEEEYEIWAARQRQPATPPEDPKLARGLAAFEQHSCGLCHRVRGTEARGTNGPDLTHFGSRMTIGAGIMPNNRRSEEHTSELQSRGHLVCRLLLE